MLKDGTDKPTQPRQIRITSVEDVITVY